MTEKRRITAPPVEPSGELVVLHRRNHIGILQPQLRHLVAQDGLSDLCHSRRDPLPGRPGEALPAAAAA
ncbi:MAG TPA: hypothetical protein VGL03_06525 [Thermoanaerobaculia bacterium]